ncbi:ROK family protein [uncultured Ruthenibacterium sp.]|uniref:ROK family protein n=1 Tax=uncultured Ruthenibacterium sp. TaxID=1905347 RepID=UPI00349EB915
MKFLNVDIPVKNLPELDQGFVPLGLFFKEYSKNAQKPLCIAVERSGGQVGVYETRIYGTPEMKKADDYYVDRLVKFLLWSWGGFKVSICGDDEVAQTIRRAYSENGSRAFDKGFMEQVYETDFVVESLPYDQKPTAVHRSESIGRHTNGGRIGFDAGGSDRKVSAVIDGEPIYSEEVVWFPKTISNPDYHYQGILAAFHTAAAKILEKGGHVDGIGISSAGVYIDNKCMVASLFLKVGKEDFDKKVKNIYTRAAKELSNTLGYEIPVVVANDGDVSALAGAMGLGENGIMGIAMGTSEAVGYVDGDGNICGWLNELAFAPVDGQPDAMEDEWSGDIGCGVKYFSQDSVIKLAPRAGIELKGESPAEKLKEVQALMAENDPRAVKVYESIGVYLGHTLALYAMFYDIRHVQMMGRVMSGKGGDIILDVASRVMNEEYPDVAFRPEAPDEKTRRVGQSAAAASLPEVK